MQSFKLNTGQQWPAIGFGTWQIKGDDITTHAVAAALRVGYRVIDTAKLYGNERGVGQAILQSGIPRSEIFVTTKLWNDDQGYDQTLKAFDASLERLGLDYVDLYLIHWPATPARHDSWRALEQIYKDGRAKAVGVSNYTVEHLQELMERSDLLPAVNQVEFQTHIYQRQKGLLEFCSQHQILVEAYSPLLRITNEPIAAIQHMAERLGRTEQQIILRWCIQHGTLPLPRSQNPSHIESNFRVFDFELTDEDMAQLDSLSVGYNAN